MTKEIQATATLPALPDGYGPDVHWGPIAAREHVWFNIASGQWAKASAAWSGPYFHAYKCKPVKRVGYVNVFRDGSIGALYQSRKHADAQAAALVSARHKRVACVRIEFEEGQFDE